MLARRSVPFFARRGVKTYTRDTMGRNRKRKRKE
jgi:hypothetical protein